MKKNVLMTLAIFSILTCGIFNVRINALGISTDASYLTHKIENAKSAAMNNRIESQMIGSNLLAKFSGSYIDDNNILHMTFTEIDTDVMGVMKDYPGVFTELARFSMIEMQEIMDLIIKEDQYNSIREIYIDEIENKLIVNYISLPNVDFRNAIQGLVNNINSSYTDMLFFTEITEKSSPKIEYDVYGGELIYRTEGIYLIECSVGFQAFKNGNLGFVTAGHCGTMGTVFQKASITLGTITARQWSGRTDAAFVDTTTSWTPIKYAQDNTRYKHVAGQNVVVGQDVDVYGSQTYYLHGKITSTNVSGTAGGVSYNSYFKYSCDTVDGDSGGLVLAYMEITPNQYQDVAIGIHTVGSGVNGLGPKAYTILIDLGLTATTS